MLQMIQHRVNTHGWIMVELDNQAWTRINKKTTEELCCRGDRGVRRGLFKELRREISFSAANGAEMFGDINYGIEYQWTFLHDFGASYRAMQPMQT